MKLKLDVVNVFYIMLNTIIVDIPSSLFSLGLLDESVVIVFFLFHVSVLFRGGLRNVGEESIILRRRVKPSHTRRKCNSFHSTRFRFPLIAYTSFSQHVHGCTFLSHSKLKYSRAYPSPFKQSLLGLSTPVDIDISFANEEQRKHVEVKVDKDRRERVPVYLDGETVNGKVAILATVLSTMTTHGVGW